MSNNTNTATNPFSGFSGGLKATLENVSSKYAPKAEQAPIPEGKYDAYVSEVTPKVYGTGAAGMRVTFAITTKELRGRKLTENFILVNKDGAQSPIGVSRFVKLLQSTGLSLPEINMFKMPTTEHDMGDLGTILNKDIQIQVKADGEYNGKPRRKVSAMYPAKQQ